MAPPSSSDSTDTIASIQYDTVPAENKACTLQAIDSDQDLQVESYGPSGKDRPDDDLLSPEGKTNISQALLAL